MRSRAQQTYPNEKSLEGALTLKITLGPSGRNVVIGMRGGTPVIPDDGVTIAEDVFLVDEIEDLSARVMREVSIQTNDKVGDGTTTALVLAEATLKKDLESVGDETDVITDHAQNPIKFKQTIDVECAALVEKLTKSAKKEETFGRLLLYQPKTAPSR